MSLNFDQASEKRALELINSYLKTYSEEVITNRAFPMIEDGNKPVLKAALAILYETLKKEKKDHLKLGTLVNNVMGQAHPHGDQSIHEAIVSATEDYISLFKPLGTFSTRGNAFLNAMRYPDITFTDLGWEYMTGIELLDKNKDYEETYSGHMIPKYIPQRFAASLFRYSLNIAVGYEGTELPLNPKEVVEATLKLAEDRKKGRVTTTEELMEIIQGPDLYKNLTTYMSRESLRSLIENGVAMCTAVADVELDDNKLIIKELPYRENVPNFAESLRNKVMKYYDKKHPYEEQDVTQLAGIGDNPLSDIEDHYDGKRDEVTITLKLSGQRPAQRVLADLYHKTNLKKTYMLKYIRIIDDKEGKRAALIPVRQILEQPVDVNIEYFRKVYTRELEALERAHELNLALEKFTRPEYSELVGKYLLKPNAKELILGIEALELTPEEYDMVAGKITVRRLSERDKLMKEIEQFEWKRDQILEKLREENLLDDTINYLRNTILPMVEKFPRRSKVIYSQVSTVAPKIRTKGESIFKEISVEGRDVWEGTTGKSVYKLRANSHLIAMTSTQFIKLPVEDIEPVKHNAVHYIGEKVYSVFPVSDRFDHNVIFVHSTAGIKVMRDAELDTRSRAIQAHPIDEGKVWTFTVPEGQEHEYVIGLVTKKRYTKAINLGQFSPKSRIAGYSRLTKLSPGDEIIWAGLVRKGFDEVTISVDKNYIISEDVWIDRIENLGNKLGKGEELEEVEVILGKGESIHV